MSDMSNGFRDEQVELRIAEWLQEGPFVAPVSSVEAVIDRVRRTPRRHPVLERLRRLVGGLPPGDALEIGLRPRSRASFAIVAGLVLTASLLMTLGVAVMGPPGPTPSPSPRLTAGPSPTTSMPVPTPAATLALPASIEGTSTCSEMDSGTMTQVGTTQVTTGVVVKCSDHWSDARLSGVGYRTYTTEVASDRSERWYGTGTTSNAGGEWNGVWTGTQAPGAPVLSNTTFWLGGNGYAGLQARVWVDIGEDGITAPRPGILEVVGPVASTGLMSCIVPGSATGNRPSLVAGRQDLTCAVRSAEDPRLSGSRTLTLTIRQRLDGAFDVTGTSRVENPAGTWGGTVSGSIAPDGRTCSLTETLSGTGLYAGFTFDGHLDGPLEAVSVAGTVAPAP